MFNRKGNRAGLVAALAGTVLCAAISTATAAAQSSDQQKKDDPSQTLKGPDVQDRDVPGTSSTFGDSQMDPAKGKQRPVSHMMFMGALRSLSGDDVPADLHATAEQTDKVKALDQEFRDARRAYMQEHRDEIRELMGQIRPEGDRPMRRPAGRRNIDGQPGRPGPKGGPDQRSRGAEPGDGPGPRIDPGTLNDEQRAAFEKLKEIRAAGPSLEDCHTKMWEVLTPEQQAYVKGRLAEMQERAAEEMQNRRGRGAGKGGKPGAPQDGQRPGRPRGDQPQRGSAPGQRADFWRPGPGPGAPGPDRFERGPGRGPAQARFGAARAFDGRPGPGPGPGFAPEFERAPGAPAMDRLAARLEALPPDVRSRVLDRIEMMLDRMESRFDRPAPPPMDGVPVPE